jgi:hypothetical protein
MHLKESRTVDGCCIHVGSFEGPNLVGSDLLLLPDPDQHGAIPPTYLFPAEGSVLQVGPSQRGSGQLSPGTAAGIALSAVAAFALLLVAGLFVVRSIRARSKAQAGPSSHADKSKYNALSKGSASAADSENSDRGSSGRADQSPVPGSTGSGGSSSQRASSNLPLLTPEQLLMISDQASVSCQGGVQGGPGFNIVPDCGGTSGNRNMVIEPVYEPVYGMFEALHGRSGDQGLQHSTRGQRLTAAISDQVRSIHHSRITNSMQVKEAGSGLSRRGSSRQTGGAGSGTGSASMGAASSSAGGDTAAAATGDAGSAAGDEGSLEDEISTDLVLHEVIGQGGFGVVYRWADFFCAENVRLLSCRITRAW